MNTLPVPQHTSPFDAIRQIENGREFWSARDVQKLLGYTKWERFEDAIERAKIACQNSGHNPDDHLPGSGKPITNGKGRKQEAKDYHLTRYACYLVAMNGDPRKPEIAAAQTYFAIKTREAEIAHEQLPATEKPQAIHTLTDALRPRALANLGTVPDGYFSVMGELFKHLYNLEAIINQGLDDKAMIEISVGQHWSTYAREQLGITNQARCKYEHTCPDGRVVEAWAYPIQYVNTFAAWLWQEYFPDHFASYRHYRALYSRQQLKRIS